MPLDNACSESLLRDESHDLKICSYCERETPSKVGKLEFTICQVIFYGAVIALASCGITSLLILSQHRDSFTLQRDSTKLPTLWSPFTDSIRYQYVTTASDLWKHSLYMGPPSEESERVWNKLLYSDREEMGVRFSREEAARLNMNIDESLPLRNDDLAIVITVHHNLHCLRSLRQGYFIDHYYPSETEHQKALRIEHSLHCLEAVRQSLICRPDLTPMTLHWTHPGDGDPTVTRECVNWDLFSDSLKARSYVDEDIITWNSDS